MLSAILFFYIPTLSLCEIRLLYSSPKTSVKPEVQEKYAEQLHFKKHHNDLVL